MTLYMPMTLPPNYQGSGTTTSTPIAPNNILGAGKTTLTAGGQNNIISAPGAFSTPTTSPAPSSPGGTSTGSNDYSYYQQSPIAAQQTQWTSNNRLGMGTLPTYSNLDQIAGAIASEVPHPNVDQGLSPEVQTILGPTPTLPPEFLEALRTQAAKRLSDFGIPQSIQEEMKVRAATEMNPAYDQAMEALRRQLSASGILNDSALTGGLSKLFAQRMGDVGKRYSDIDIAAAEKQQEQYLQNLKDIEAASMTGSNFLEGAKQARGTLAEKGREFNVGANLDAAKLDAALQQWAESGKLSRTQLAEAVSEFLENYELNRLKISQGLAEDAHTVARDQANTLQGILANSSSPSLFTSLPSSLGSLFGGGGAGAAAGAAGAAR